MAKQVEIIAAQQSSEAQADRITDPGTLEKKTTNDSQIDVFSTESSSRRSRTFEVSREYVHAKEFEDILAAESIEYRTEDLEEMTSDTVVRVEDLNRAFKESGLSLKLDSGKFRPGDIIGVDQLKNLSSLTGTEMGSELEDQTRGEVFEAAANDILVTREDLEVYLDTLRDRIEKEGGDLSVIKGLENNLAQMKGRTLNVSVNTNLTNQSNVVKSTSLVDPRDSTDGTFAIHDPGRRLPSGHYMFVEIVNRFNVRKDFFLPDGRRMNSLKLTINPNTLSINSAKIINRYQTLTRWVEDHWGDELDQVSFSGNTYAFMVLNDAEATAIGTGVKPGLVNKNRRHTQPYQELRHFAALAQSNALLRHNARIRSGTEPRQWFHTMDPSKPTIMRDHPRAGMVKERLYVKIILEYVRLLGYFESFDVIEDANSPFKLAYNVNFKAEKTEWV